MKFAFYLLGFIVICHAGLANLKKLFWPDRQTKLVKTHQLAETKLICSLQLVQHAIVLPIPLRTHIAPDAGDQFLWDLLNSREELKWVTGDKLLLKEGPLQDRVMTLARFAGRN